MSQEQLHFWQREDCDPGERTLAEGGIGNHVALIDGKTVLYSMSSALDRKEFVEQAIVGSVYKWIYLGIGVALTAKSDIEFLEKKPWRVEV